MVGGAGQESIEVILPVLHGGLDEASFSADGFVAEVVERKVHAIESRHIVDNSVLEVVNEFEILFLEAVFICLDLVQG